jgi:hypothetical protein
MLLKNVSRSALVLALAVGAVGCASIPRAPKERDAEVKAFKSTPGKANLYVFRDEGMGGAVTMTVLLDGKPVGQTSGHTFVFTQVDPGAHKLISQAENDFELPITAEAGKNVFVWQEVKMGVFKARSNLHLVDDKRGQEGVNACELVAPFTGQQ